MGGTVEAKKTFRFGLYRSFIFSFELATCATFTLYQFVQSLPNPIMDTTSKGAHPISWAFVFAFATFVRLTVPKGETYREVSIYGLEAILIACLPVGATELVWDFGYLVWLTYSYPLQNIFFTQTAMIGMMLSGTAVAVGLVLIRWRFNKNRLGLAFAALIAYHAVWVLTGFHLSTDPLYRLVFEVHLTEVGHWAFGASAFWWAYGFRRHIVKTPIPMPLITR